MKKLTIIVSILALFVADANAFCGFYVAKADAKLFNKSSQVIIARNGDRSVITMSNDFEGAVKDFAMVIPVPEVLDREDIRVVESSLFTKLDGYSGPRLVEYFDRDPCYVPHYSRNRSGGRFKSMSMTKEDGIVPERSRSNAALGVTVKAKYAVGDYDIMILDATKSKGLETWLTQNGYKIPEGADEVLQPYIRNNMKFFVVKVNLARAEKSGVTDLKPLQIEFNSDKFMLPIRLGMANSDGNQDMIVYMLSTKGRVETVNYRTVRIPTNRNIPLVVKTDGLFPEMYKDLFETAYEKEGKNGVFLEYAWDISGNAGVKCDPCTSPPPIFTDLKNAGVNWLTLDPRTNQYFGSVFFTRMHVRYNRKDFPQDLTFQETPDRQRFQGRYIVRNPAKSGFQCDAAQNYLVNLHHKRKVEVDELAALTGWSTSKFDSYITEYDSHLRRPERKDLDNTPGPDRSNLDRGALPFGWIMFGGLGGLLLLSFVAKVFGRKPSAITV